MPFASPCWAGPREQPSTAHIQAPWTEKYPIADGYSIYARNNARCIRYKVCVFVQESPIISIGDNGLACAIIAPQSTVIVGQVSCKDGYKDCPTQFSAPEIKPFDYLCQGDDPATKIEIDQVTVPPEESSGVGKLLLGIGGVGALLWAADELAKQEEEKKKASPSTSNRCSGCTSSEQTYINNENAQGSQGGYLCATAMLCRCACDTACCQENVNNAKKYGRNCNISCTQ